MATTVARLQAVLSADTGQFDKAMNRSEGKMSKVGKVAGIAGLAVAGGLAVGLKKSVSAALESEKAQARLESAFKSAGVEAKGMAAANKAISATSRRAALDDEALSDVYAKLLRTTKDATEAQKGMSLAADIARARNISLEAAAKGVERAYNGSAAGLGRFGVEIQKSTGNVDLLKAKIDQQKESMKGLKGAQLEAAKAQLDSLEVGMKAAQIADQQATATNALDRAQKQFAGSAEEYGKTTAGAQERFQVALENLQEKIGTAVLPMLRDFITQLIKLLDWVEKNERTVKIIIASLGGLAAVLLTVSVATKAASAAIAIKTAAVTAWNIATKAATAAQWLLNAALTANPIGVVALALAGLTAAVILAYQKSETFQKIVDKLWESLKDLGGWMKDQWPKAKKVFVEALDAIIAPFRTLKNLIDKVVDGIKWLIEHIPDIPKPSLPDIPFIGGNENAPRITPAAPTAGAVGSLLGASGQLAPIASLGAGFGLSVTSGLRKWDTDSDHGIGKAIDISNTYKDDPDGTPEMDAAFAKLAGMAPMLGIKDLLYTPGLWKYGFNIDNGRRAAFSVAGHGDHIHASVFDQGGILKPGYTLAYNGTGRNEYVTKGQPILVSINMNDKEVARALFDAMRAENARQSRLGRGLT